MVSTTRSFMRVDPLGRRGSAQVDAALARKNLAMTQRDPDDARLTVFGWELHLDDRLEHFVAYVDSRAYQIVVSPDTWTTLSFAPEAITHLMDDCKSGADGIRFLTWDNGVYADAVRKQAAQTDTSPLAMSRLDSMVALRRAADSVMTQAIGVAEGGAQSADMEIFMVNLSDVEVQYQALAERLAEVRTVLDVAANSLRRR